MTKLEQAVARAAKGAEHADALHQAVANIVFAEEQKAKERIGALRRAAAEKVKAIEAAADEKARQIHDAVEQMKTPEVRKSLVAVADKTRKDFGLAPKGQQAGQALAA